MNSPKLYTFLFIPLKGVNSAFFKVSLILLFILGLPLEMNAQEETVIDHKGTLTTVRNNVVSSATTAPTTPLEGDIWFDTTDASNPTISVWNGTAWQEIKHNGTAGSLFFANASGEPTEDNTQLFWDDTNNRLGIGTNTPTNELDVNGSLRVQNITTTTSDLDVLVTTTTGVVQKRPFVDFSSGISGTEGSIFFASSTGSATESNTQFFWNNTNSRLGIGTNTPTSTLHHTGSYAAPILTTTAALTLDESHHTIIISDSDHDITLPAASSCTGRIYVVKNPTDTDSNISSFLNHKGNSRTKITKERVYWLQSDGTNWHLISRI